jgi:hypothetical protein
MWGMKRRAEMHPLSGLNDRQELLAFFHREYREMLRLVWRLRVRGTENSYDSHSSFVAAERECNHSVRGCIPLPKAQNVPPAAVAYALEELG